MRNIVNYSCSRLQYYITPKQEDKGPEAVLYPIGIQIPGRSMDMGYTDGF